MIRNNAMMENTTVQQVCRSRRFSGLYIDIFQEIIQSAKTNREISAAFGYSEKSDAIISHSRKVMRKLLYLENLPVRQYQQRIIYPRQYRFWWAELFNKHKPSLLLFCQH
ncbi:hypothetical protein FW774_15265 [Pedobacter sp. BS3]|uniref:hypothetical protein n=1 Tax=Pedobacter sp. BS3 TaxID=2567937 RepID=UPI0011EDCDD7|nr:hypothetical protein [Pedobacter sp. BS3]TZF82052.1 hypothetical protein FW774_15265 [Pedobacter sp. BS3]